MNIHRAAGSHDGTRRPQNDSVDIDDPRVVAAAQEYLAAIESGRPLNRTEFLARHRDIAGDLAQCLEGLELVHAAAADMRKAEAVQSAVRKTAAAHADSQNSSLPLGDFRIVREIGRGGMGVVYEAIQLSLGRRVAVKILPFAASLDPKHLQRFKNESQAAAQLHHTNIVPVYAVGSERGVHFYAMQMIDGEPLSQLIEHLRQQSGKTPTDDGRAPGATTRTLRAAGSRTAGRSITPGSVGAPGRRGGNDPTMPLGTPASPPGPVSRSGPDSRSGAGPQAGRPTVTVADIPTVTAQGSSTVLSDSHSSRPEYFRTVVRLMQQTALALEHAHEMGIVHRDIKPANLILDRRGNIWVTDFGLAQFHADANLTRTGDMMGTLRVHEPGASGRRSRGARSSHRHLFAGRDALRNADAGTGVPRRQSTGFDRPDPER